MTYPSPPPIQKCSPTLASLVCVARVCCCPEQRSLQAPSQHAAVWLDKLDIFLNLRHAQALFWKPIFKNHYRYKCKKCFILIWIFKRSVYFRLKWCLSNEYARKVEGWQLKAQGWCGSWHIDSLETCPQQHTERASERGSLSCMLVMQGSHAGIRSMNRSSRTATRTLRQSHHANIFFSSLSSCGSGVVVDRHDHNNNNSAISGLPAGAPPDTQ